MGSITRTLFGGSKEESKTIPKIIPRLPPVTPSIGTEAGSFLRATPQFTQIPNPSGPGSIFQLGGIDTEIGLPAEISALRGESLAGTRSLLRDVQGDISTLRGLENPFVQARVQPFIAEQERARRDAIRRGVAGPLTSLATNPFTARIAEEGARATFEAQQFIQQVTQQNRELLRGLLSDISGEGQRLLEQELALLGLGQQQIRDIIASQLEQPTAQRVDARAESQEGIFEQINPGSLLGGFAALCWVAREVYGQDDPRWIDFRAWLLTKAPEWFRNLYIKHGERFSKLIRKKPRIKRLVRWGMEKVLTHG